MNKAPVRLFDCDGLLVKSESIAFHGCCGVVNRVLSEKGIALEFTPQSLLARFVGQSFRGMITTLATERNFAFADGELQKLILDEEDAVIAALESEVEATEGVSAFLARIEGVRAVVSSSSLRRVKVCLKKSLLEQYFPPQNIFSATSSLPTPTTKPDRAIYVHALNVLGTTADRAIAYEDSKSGVISAKSAGIPLLGYVGAYPDEEQEEMKTILIRAGAAVVIHNWDDVDDAEKEVIARARAKRI